jgi:O-antigen/teichoic acid export membrane protein
MTNSRHTLVQHVRNLIVVGAGNYGAMAISFAINAMLARRLGTEQFGRLSLLLVTSQVLALVIANWTHSALVRFGAAEFSASGSVAETLWARLGVVVPGTIVAGLAMFLWRDAVAHALSVPAWGLLVLMAHLGAAVALSIVGGVFQARQDMRRYGLALFADKAVLALLVLFLPVALMHDPLVVLGMYAASSAGVAALAVVSLGRIDLRPRRFRREAWRAMLAFSLPLFLSSWAGLFGTSWFDLLIIKQHHPLSQLGLYSLATLLAGMLQQLTIIFSTLLLPQLSVMVARSELDRLRRVVSRLYPYWFLGTALLCSLVLLVSGVVVPMVFGDSYASAVPAFAILIVASSVLALFTAMSPLLTAFGSTWVFTGIGLAGGGINVIADLLLIPRYGINGAAAATVCAYVTAAALALRFARHRLNVSAYSFSVFVTPVLIAWACVLTLSGVRVYLVALPAIAVSAYWLVRRFGLFSREDAGLFESVRVATPAVPALRVS